MIQRKLIKVMLLGMMVAAGTAQAKPAYTVTSLEKYSSDAMWLYLNNQGQVAGMTSTTALVLSGGSVREIEAGEWGHPILNNRGDISMYVASVNQAYFYSHDGGKVAIPGLYPQGQSSNFAPWGMNDQGAVVGKTNCWEATCASQSIATVYANGTTTSLGTLGGASSSAFAINNTGQIVGSAQDSYGTWKSFIYSNGKMQTIGNAGAAIAINDAGQVLMGSSSEGYPFIQGATLYENGKTRTLGLGGDSSTEGVALNNRGEVIGRANFWDLAGYRSWIYTEGKVWDLNDLVMDPDWVGIRAMDLNDKGQILAEANYGNGRSEFLLLSPEGVPAIPEPGTYAMLLGGLGILAVRRFQRQVS